MKSVVVAFSGGVDSTFLVAAAKRAGLDRLLAVTVDSCFVPRKEIERAKALATRLSVEHQVVDADILDVENVRNNAHDRCYFCKLNIFGLVREIARKEGIPCVLHGVNLDDLADYRPGMKAAGEMGFAAPLLDAGFTKARIRACSREMGLETWDLPSQSCLAARIPYGDPITRQTLSRIEAAEVFLQSLAFDQVRVRDHGGLARLELDESAFLKLCNDKTLRQQVSETLKDMGFDFVSLDLAGYCTGSMNAVIDMD